MSATAALSQYYFEEKDIHRQTLAIVFFSLFRRRSLLKPRRIQDFLNWFKVSSTHRL
jgi:hypothetical protein